MSKAVRQPAPAPPPAKAAGTDMAPARPRAESLSPLVPLLLVLLSSCLAWGVLFTVFPPAVQDFPLNDDWAFGRGAILFAEGKGIHYSGWASMPQLGQWLWALPFLWLLGPSFFALRLSTVLLSWLGLWAFFDLLRGEGWTNRAAALATATLAFNPLFFLLQGTFLTDVPALSFCLIALALFVRGLRGGGSWPFLAGACLVAVLGAISRQNTLAVPAAAVLLLWREREQRRRVLAWLTVALPLVVGLATHFWFQQRSDVRALHPQLIDPNNLFLFPFLLLHFCGLAALPVLIVAFRPHCWKTFSKALACLALAAGYWLLYGILLPYGGLFPYSENMLSPFGAFAGNQHMGPYIVGTRPVLLGVPSRIVLSVLGCVGGAALAVRLLRQDYALTRLPPLLLFTILQLPFLLIAPGIFDRYLLFLLPGALLLAGTGEEVSLPYRPLQILPGLAAVLVFAVFSVGLMHDWLAWNSARWELGGRALKAGIAPLDIEGGFEWDALYSSLDRSRTRPGPRKYRVLRFTEGWFPKVRGHFALSFSEVPRARRLDSQPYSFWLLPGERHFYLLEMSPLPQPAPGSERSRRAP